MISHIFIILAAMAVGVLELWLGLPVAWVIWTLAAWAMIYREVTQEEYRDIEHKRGGLRSGMGWAGEGLEVWDWNKHSILQSITALTVGAIAAYLLDRFTFVGSM